MKQITPAVFFVWIVFMTITVSFAVVFMRDFFWHYHIAEEKLMAAKEADKEICSIPEKVKAMEMQKKCDEVHETLHSLIVMDAVVATIEQYYICRGVSNCGLILYALLDKLTLITIFGVSLMILITISCGCSVISTSRNQRYGVYDLPMNQGGFGMVTSKGKNMDTGAVDEKSKWSNSKKNL